MYFFKQVKQYTNSIINKGLNRLYDIKVNIVEYIYEIPNHLQYYYTPNNNCYFYQNNVNNFNYNKNFPNFSQSNNLNNQNTNIRGSIKNKNDNMYSNYENYEKFTPNPQMTHLRGLVNIESTCYMNSILQCFCHIKELSDYFQTNKMNQLSYYNLNNENKLFPAFHEIVINLWNLCDESPYSPYNFKKRLGKMNPLFSGPVPNDAKDLLTFILIELHEELNKPKRNNNINNNNLFNANRQLNKKLMFDTFKKAFINNNLSIISGLFFGINYTEAQCHICKNIIYNYEAFNFIIFPLHKVLQYKIASNNFISNFNNTVTLYDCFEHYRTITYLNDYYCNICNNNGNCKFRTNISILPNVLIIILNRGTGLQYKVNISFDNENLGLKNYVEYYQEESFYELIGLVTHYGESSASGHFVARCKSPIDNEWYLYNDQIIQKIGYFNNETFSQGNPYILFYKKINFQK